MKKEYILPPELIEELESLPNKYDKWRDQWDAEKDAILIKVWLAKRQEDVAAWWKARYGWGSVSTLKRHHHELMTKRNKQAG